MQSYGRKFLLTLRETEIILETTKNNPSNYYFKIINYYNYLISKKLPATKEDRSVDILLVFDKWNNKRGDLKRLLAGQFMYLDYETTYKTTYKTKNSGRYYYEEVE